MQTITNTYTSNQTYYKINKNWDNLKTVSTNKNLNERSQKALHLIRTVITKNKCVTYKYFQTSLNRTQDQIRRYFRQIEDAGLMKVSFITSMTVGSKKLRNVLVFKLTEKGRAELGIVEKKESENPSFDPEQIRTKNDSTLYIYKEDNIKKDLDKLDPKKNENSSNHSESKLSKFLNIPKEKEKEIITLPIKITDLDPITEDEAYLIRLKTDRHYSCNFMNQLLQKLQKVKPNNVFYSRTIFLKYFRSVIRNELRTQGVVNSENFTMRINMTSKDVHSEEIEKFLSEIENGYGANKEDQLRRKLAAKLPEKVAYELLSSLIRVNEPQVWDFNEKVNASNKSIMFVLSKDIEISDMNKIHVIHEVKAVYGEHVEKVFFNKSDAEKKQLQNNDSKIGGDVQLTVAKTTISDTFLSAKEDILGSSSYFTEKDFEYVIGDELCTAKNGNKYTKIFIKQGFNFMLNNEIINHYERKGMKAEVFISC